MICRNCGNEIRDDAKFCPHCGTVSGAEGQPSSYAGPEGPVPGMGRGKKGLLIGGIVAAVAVVALVAVVAGNLFSDPKGQLGRAVAKTVAAYEAASDSMGLPDLNKLTERRSVSERFSMELRDINSALVGYDMSAFNGLGVRFSSDLDRKDRKMGFALGAFWGDEDIVSLEVLADDNKMYFSSPQFTGGTAYGVNTETLGADMKALGAEDIEDISFNLFDLVDSAAPESRAKEMEQAIKEANRDFWEAVRVEKAGKKALDINGTSVNAQAFRVVIPKKAMKNYVDGMADAISAVNYVELYREMLEATGMSQRDIDTVMEQMEDVDLYDELADSLKDAVDVLGDVRLSVYVSEGLICAVSYDERIRGTDVEAALYLGGGTEYVDDLSLELSVDGNQVQITSSGDHGGKGGSFTDKTTIRLRSGGVSVGRVTSDFLYDPKKGSDNLQWDIGLDSAGSLEMRGQLTAGKDSMEVHLEEMSFQVMGLELFSLGMDYYMGPCQGVDLSAAAPKLIGEMNGVELMGLVVNLEANAQTWMTDVEQMFVNRLPAELYDELF